MEQLLHRGVAKIISRGRKKRCDDFFVSSCCLPCLATRVNGYIQLSVGLCRLAGPLLGNASVPLSRYGCYQLTICRLFQIMEHTFHPLERMFYWLERKKCRAEMSYCSCGLDDDCSGVHNLSAFRGRNINS